MVTPNSQKGWEGKVCVLVTSIEFVRLLKQLAPTYTMSCIYTLKGIVQLFIF